MSENTGNNAPKTTERTLLEGVLHYLTILLRYRVFIVVVTLLAAIGVVAFSIVSLRLPPEDSPLPNRYRASAILLIGEDPTGGGMETILESLGMSVPRTGTSPGRLAMQVLTSRSFIDDIIEAHNMLEYYNMEGANRSRRRNVVLANSSFNHNANTGTLTISYEDIRPEYAQEVANGIVEQLERYFRERGGLTRGRTLEALEETLTEVEQEVADIEAQIRQFQQQYGVLSVEELANSQSGMLRNLEAELVQLERSIRTYTERTRIENDPELIRMRSERNTVAELIEQIEQGYAGGSRTMPARSELPDLSLRLGRLRTDLALQQRIRTSLQEQYEIARLSAETNLGFTVLEWAEVPDEKVGPFRGQISMRVTLGAFGAAIALALAHYGLTVLLADPKLMAIVRKNLNSADAGDGARKAKSGASPRR